MGRFAGFWATPHLLLLAESSVGTLELLRDSKNEASRYVSNPSLTAVFHAGALGPLDERCPGRAGMCGWVSLLYKECSVDSMVKVGRLCPGIPHSTPPIVKRPGTRVSAFLVGGLQRLLRPQAPVPGVDTSRARSAA